MTVEASGEEAEPALPLPRERGSRNPTSTNPTAGRPRITYNRWFSDILGLQPVASLPQASFVRIFKVWGFGDSGSVGCGISGDGTRKWAGHQSPVDHAYAPALENPALQIGEYGLGPRFYRFSTFPEEKESPKPTNAM